ncbi:hypothetical protein RCJ22_26795 [Vibrio sp. FNV 38]|nr:hypothetical protein [Vibrio sp. FNV 38]
MSKKLENVTNLYLEGIRDGHAEAAIKKYTGCRYTQHSTGVGDGVDGFVEFFQDFIKRCRVRDIQIIRSIVDGQYVFVQAFQDINNGEAKWVTTDLFDTDKNDKIIEHWDVISAYETEPGSMQDQIGGPTQPSATTSTEESIELVRNFLRNVMVLGDCEDLDKYCDLDNLHSHSAPNTETLSAYIGCYDQVFKVIGQGDMVVAYSRVNPIGQELARFDVFRVKDGKIVELWVNQEPVPPKDEWVNGGKF